MNAPHADDPGWAAPPNTIEAPPEARVVITATTLSPEGDGSVRVALHRREGYPYWVQSKGDIVRFDAPTKCVTPLDALCPGCRAVILHEEPA